MSGLVFRLPCPDINVAPFRAQSGPRLRATEAASVHNAVLTRTDIAAGERCLAFPSLG